MDFDIITYRALIISIGLLSTLFIVQDERGVQGFRVFGHFFEISTIFQSYQLLVS